MIALRVYGDGRRWRAQVVAWRGLETRPWTPIVAPEMPGRWPETAARAAIRAYDRGQRPRIRCERTTCGYTWTARLTTRPPRRCPKCMNPPTYSPRHRARLRARKLAAKLQARKETP